MSSANLPALPPLLCSTPPPIDFGEEDEDDSNLPSALSLDDDEDMFGDFADASTNDGGESADANADVPSLPQTPVHTEFPPLSTLCFADQGCNSPPPLEIEASPGRTDKQINKPAAQIKVKPIEAFNLNVTLGVAAVETNPLDSDSVIPSNDHRPSDSALVEPSQAEVEPDSIVTLLKCDSLSPKDLETPPPCSPSSTDDDEIAEDAWPQLEDTKNDDLNKTDVSCEQIAIEGEAEEKTKEAISVTPEMFSCSSSSVGNDSVVLEDIADDSSDDERHSPKKHKSLIVVADESSAEFYEIHPLPSGANVDDGVSEHDTLSSTQLHEEFQSTSAADEIASMQISSTTNSRNDKEETHDEEDIDDFDDFASFDTTAASIFVPELVRGHVSTSSDENANAFEANFSQFSDFNSSPPSQFQLPSDANVNNQDEQNLNTACQEATTFASLSTNANCAGEDDDDFDDDDFQEFCAGPSEISQPQVGTATGSNDNSQSDSYDDFGDFSEATFGTVSGPLTPSTPTTATLQCASTTSHINNNSSTDTQVLGTATATVLNQSEINVRLKPVLEMMFPIAAAGNDDDKEDDVGVKKLQPSCSSQITKSNISRGLQLESIDSARALEYHWTKSEMRHALIKSLGIDSRNILFGEKWNSSMPRFAANLSFNPLKPMKPTTIFEGSSAMTTQFNQMQQQTNDANGPARGVDVPAVEFDWTSSGLVNPLDGPKEDIRTREAEALHSSKSGRSIADASSSSAPAADGGQESHTNDADDIGGSRGGDVDANCSNADCATAATTIAGATAATTLPSTVPADSVGNGINNNGNHTHLGYLSSGIFTAPERTGDDVLIADAENEMKASLSGGVALMSMQVGLAKPVDEKVCGNSEDDDDDDDEVVATSTFSGPLKETHIYTPSKGEGGNGCAVAKSTARSGSSNQPTKVSPIDFDYEIAAAGIIIDETVVKKEYRDVEYNPGFGLQFSRTSPPAQLIPSVEVGSAASSSSSKPFAEISTAFAGINIGESSSFAAKQSTAFDDEFSDFQSVAATTVSLSAASTFSRSMMSADNMQPTPPMAVTKMRENSTISRTGTPTFGDQMILSPAILLPQAIVIDSGKPKIEWGGDSLNSINPEEMARIEELFPQPLAKHAVAARTKEAMVNSSQRSTPTHDGQKHTPSISAAIAHKEQQQSGANDDDDWSDFVSVPAAAAATVPASANDSTASKMHSNNSNSNNNNHLTSHQRHCSPPVMHPHHQQHQHRQQHATYSPHKSSVKALAAPAMTMTTAATHTNNYNNDDEWSDFVSSAPPPATAMPQFRANAPQFNSAAWQNANFYNNPLSFYHQSHTTVVPNANANSNAFNAQLKLQNNNNTNQYLSNYQQQPKSKQQQHTPSPASAQQFQPQKIHIMKDFSTAAPSTQNTRSNTIGSQHVTAASAYSNIGSQSQYQVGSAKVAPSISLIPDLGFVAPAIPAHTAFIHNLPKPSFQTKK